MKPFPCMQDCKQNTAEEQNGKYFASAEHRREGGWYLALDTGNGTTKNACDEERVSACSSEESVLSEDLCEVTVEADSDGEERVLLPAGVRVNPVSQ